MRKLMTRKKYNRSHGTINGFVFWQQYKFESAKAWAQAEKWNAKYEQALDAKTDKHIMG